MQEVYWLPGNICPSKVSEDELGSISAGLARHLQIPPQNHFNKVALKTSNNGRLCANPTGVSLNTPERQHLPSQKSRKTNLVFHKLTLSVMLVFSHLIV